MNVPVFSASGELARRDLPLLEADLVIKTKRGQWVEVALEWH